MLPLRQIVLIGAGNVAGHLGKQFLELGIPIAQVYSRGLDKARRLGQVLDAPATDQLSTVFSLPDCLYVLAVKDDAIEAVARALSFLDGAGRIFVHTSGAVSSEALAPYFRHYGVFYPLQTLTIDREVNFQEIPLCVYAAEEAVGATLRSLAGRLSDQVYAIDDERRKVLHVAAVIVNNFVNHLFDVGQQLVEREGLAFDLLRPLIRETAAKVMDDDPRDMQTGPARRKDERTILAHLHYLQRYPNWQDLYRVMTDSIANQFPPHKIH